MDDAVIWSPNATRAFGLVPLFLWYLATGSYAAMSVVITGVVSHFLFPQSFILSFAYATCISCVALFAFVSSPRGKFVDLFFAGVAGASQLTNRLITKTYRAVAHVVGVQLPILVTICFCNI